MISTGLLRKVSNRLGLKLSPTTKDTSKTYFQYKDIPLKLFIEIASEGSFRKLVKSGKYNDVECLEQWELIVKENHEVTGSTQWSDQFYLMQGYEMLRIQHCIVRALLVKMRFDPDEGTYDELKRRGYQLNLTSKAAYKQSFKVADARCKNIVTKAAMKLKELERSKEGSSKVKGRTFDSVMVDLNMAIAPQHEDDNITLARYNEYLKLIKERNRQMAAKNYKHGRV